ncbi:unnamed protein product, partial [Rotaria sp. Silwood2]
MPPKSRRQAHAQAAALGRHHSQDHLLSFEKEYDSITPMDIEDGKQEYGEQEEDDDVADGMDFKDKMDLPSIGDVFELCKRGCGSRKLSVLLYMVLRHFGHTWRAIDALLHDIDGNQCRVAHKWTKSFLTGDFNAFEDDGRDGKHSDGFYDLFPELETEAKVFVIESCSKKSADFSAIDLAKYLDKRFYELTQASKINDTLVRSSESCRLDLRRWGA